MINAVKRKDRTKERILMDLKYNQNDPSVRVEKSPTRLEYNSYKIRETTADTKKQEPPKNF